jgi:hypothetical protein
MVSRILATEEVEDYIGEQFKQLSHALPHGDEKITAWEVAACFTGMAASSTIVVMCIVEDLIAQADGLGWETHLNKSLNDDLNNPEDFKAARAMAAECNGLRGRQNQSRENCGSGSQRVTERVGREGR